MTKESGKEALAAFDKIAAAITDIDTTTQLMFEQAEQLGRTKVADKVGLFAKTIQQAAKAAREGLGQLPAARAEKPKSEGSPGGKADDTILFAHRWKEARGRWQAEWARQALAAARGDQVGAEPNRELTREIRDEMEQAMSMLEGFPPHTVGGVCQAIDVAADLLLSRMLRPDEEIPGDVAQILINARSSLEWLDGAMQVGPDPD